MFSFGFYNSQNEDRLYNASHFGKIFDGVIQDGVFGTIKATGKQPFQLEPTTTPSLSANINLGKAWLGHTWNLLDSMAALTFSDVTSPSKKRTDAVCIEVNNSYTAEGFTPRTNGIVIVKGSDVSYSGDDVRPSLTDWQQKNSVGEYIIWRFPIAYVTIYGSKITKGNITYNPHVIETVNITTAVNPSWVEKDSSGNPVGKYETWTPLVTGATLDATDYIPSIADFEAAFNKIIEQDQGVFNSWMEGLHGLYTEDDTPTAALNKLNIKIDSKILFGTTDPSLLPDTDLSPGQVYFQIED